MQIQNYYAEVIGPIACIKRGILSGLIDTAGLGGSSIFMPPDSERLYDYKLIVGNDEHLISAKSARGVSNQVKPQFVTAAAIRSGKLGLLQNTKEFNLLNLLGTENVVVGALKGWSMIAPNEIGTDAANSVISVYKNGAHNTKIPDPELLKPFTSFKSETSYHLLILKMPFSIRNLHPAGNLLIPSKNVSVE